LSTSYRRINIDYVEPSPYNTRIYFDEDGIESLSESIRDHDQIQPLVVRPRDDGRFEIVSGERRYRALKKGGSKYANCIVKDLTDSEAMWYQLEENREREDYSDYENALKMQQLIEEDGLTQGQLAEKLGMSQSYVNHYLKMLELENYYHGNNQLLNKLTERQAREILGAPAAVRDQVAEGVAEKYGEKGEVPTAASIRQLVDILSSIRKSYEYRPETGEPDLPELGDPIKDLDRKLEEEVREEQKRELEQELEPLEDEEYDEYDDFEEEVPGCPYGLEVCTHPETKKIGGCTTGCPDYLDMVAEQEETERQENQIEVEIEIDWFSDFDDLRENWWWPYVDEAMERSLTHIANNYILRNLENLKQQDASNQALKEFLKQECSHHGHSGPDDPTLRGKPQGLEVIFEKRKFRKELTVKITWGGLLRKANMMPDRQEKEEPEEKIEAEPELDKSGRVFSTIRHMFSEFGNPDPMFVRSVIAHEHDLTDSEASRLYSKYMKQQQQEQEPEPEGEAESEQGFDEVGSGWSDGTVCPLCGQMVSERQMAVIEDLLENLGAEEVMNRIINAANHSSSREAHL